LFLSLDGLTEKIGSVLLNLAQWITSQNRSKHWNLRRDYFHTSFLSDAIPCLTLPLGANADTNLDVEFGGTRNFDMQGNYENSWPLGRGAGQYPAGTTFGEWHHSDVRAVAYTFTYKLFNQMVTLGNLK